MPNGYPDKETAEKILEKSEKKNPGPWVRHSRNVAQAAKNIAECCPGLDAKKAYVLGLLHDVGRRECKSGLSHTVDGYRYCMSQGYPVSARICLTHSFPGGSVGEGQGEWTDGEDRALTEKFLSGIQYDEYDRLIQLCDALGAAEGFCLMEKRLVDVVLQHGANECTQAKWKALFEVKSHFETMMGKSIYTVLPGVVENTFPGMV